MYYNSLFETVFANDLDCLKQAVESFFTFTDIKKKINVRDIYKRTLLFYSIPHASFDLIEYLLINGSDTLFVDYKGRTVLHYACILNCEKKII